MGSGPDSILSRLQRGEPVDVVILADAALEELINLSTQAFTYFQSKGGFLEGTPEDLPPGRREKYDASGRNSKVLIKKVAKVPKAEVATTLS